jgi:hypothetical protein
MRIDRNWVSENLKRATLTGAIVYSLDVNRDKSEISRYECGALTDPDELIGKVMRDAEAFASALNGVQTFLFVFVDEEERSLASMTFSMDGGMQGDAGVASEPPTGIGLQAQLMRHLENRERVTNAVITGVVSMQAKTIDRLSLQNEKLVSEKFATLEMVESLMSGKHVRDMELKRVEKETETRKAVIEKIGPYLSAVLNKVNGEPLVRQRSTELEMSVQEFIKEVTPSQMDKIAQSGIFTQGQLVTFSTMLEQVAKVMMTEAQQREQAEAVHRANMGEPSKGGT